MTKVSDATQAEIAAAEAEQAERDRRIFRRALLELAGTVLQDGGRADCVVLDLSLTGAKIQVDDDLDARGNKFQLSLAKKLRIASPVELPVEVVWQSGPVAGLRFMMEADEVAAALERILPAECMNFDTVSP